MLKPGPLAVEAVKKGVLMKTPVRKSITDTAISSDVMPWGHAKPYFHIPKVPTVPVLGSGWQFLPFIGPYDFHKRDEANRRKIRNYGSVFRERFNDTEYLICSTLEDLRTIVQAEGQHPIAMELTSVKAYREARRDLFSTKGLLCLQGQEWLDLRRATEKHVLKPKALHRYVAPIQKVAKDFVERIHAVKDNKDEVHDLLNEIYKWSLECVCLFGLDKRLGCLSPYPPSEARRLIDSAVDMFEAKTKLETFTGWVTFGKRFRMGTWRKFERASDIFTDITFKYINEAAADIPNNPKNLTVLQSMLHKKDLELSDAVVFVSDLLLAGMDTTSYTAGFLLYHLAMYPQKQELVYREILELLPTDYTQLTPDVMDRFKYLKACWNESMRLTPIVPARGRILSEDVVLSGYQVPAGTHVGVLYEPIYMDESIFKNPSAFSPERWLNPLEKPPKFAFQPFGYGLRSCIGKRLAEIQMITLIAEILREFRVDYKYEDIGCCSKLLNVPDKPLRFNFIPREPRSKCVLF